MGRYDVVFIGAGANPETQDNEGFSITYRHASAQERLDE